MCLNYNLKARQPTVKLPK